MKTNFRRIFDKIFTVLTGFAVLSLIVVLFVILGPMFYEGLGAVFFEGTVEFRKMQLAEFGHGNQAQIRKETEKTKEARAKVYDMIESFKSGVDTEQLTERAKEIYRNFRNELQLKELPREQYTALRSLSRDVRDRLIEAFSSNNIEQIRRDVEYVLQYENDKSFVNTAASGFFKLARQYQKAATITDLDKRQEYWMSWKIL